MSSMTTTDNKAFLNELARLVGSSHLLTDPAKTARYRKGFRSGQGDALAVVFPGSLLELWRVLKACVTADKIILMQAANTGLTEGSTPNGNDYDRDVVIISTLRLDKLHVLGKGEQVLAYPGTTLYSLEKALKPLGREPHSVIGSSCIGASVIGGICNNSGGSLVQRGPAYTEMSLFARINEDGKLTLVNHLGIDLGETPEQILSKLDDDRIKDDDVRHDGRHAHDYDYVHRVRDIEADTPALVCTPEEGSKAFLHRFAAAGAAIRYQAVHSDEVEDILALDIALRRNDTEWYEHLPPEIDSQLVHKLYYGHFMCYVFHQDYIVKKGVDVHALKEQMLELLQQRGAQYPAEHNVGHLYKAPETLQKFYRENDPTNSMNPGIGKTSKRKNWQEVE